MVFSIFDRCAVNYPAHAILQGVAPDTLAIGCVSHTTSHVGEHAELLLVKTMVEGLNIATHSIGARTLFQAEYNEVIEGHSDIRWYCVYNQAKQQYRGYEHLAPWVDRLSASNYVAQTVVKLRTALSQADTLHLQLAVMVDAIDPFVLCCTHWKGMT